MMSETWLAQRVWRSLLFFERETLMMKVIFETAGGQQLKAEVSGDDWNTFVQMVSGLCKEMRTRSYDAYYDQSVSATLARYSLVAKEPAQRA